MSRPVLTERRDRVLIVTMNRPKLRNAVNLEMAQGIDAALDTLDTDPELRVGIITGAGSTFCSGMDLKAFGEGEQPYTESRGFAGIAKRGPAKPLLAAIEGYAVAGGLEIALCCDVLVADRGAQLGIPEVKRGLVAAGGALLSLPERLPYHVAIEMAGGGQRVLLGAVRMQDQAGGGAMPEGGDVLARHPQKAVLGIGVRRHPQDRSQAVRQPEGVELALCFP